MKMTLREEAEQIVESEFCGACDGGEVNCGMQDICDGYKEEVERVLKEWATEDAARVPE
jgi:hypothetical protein